MKETRWIMGMPITVCIIDKQAIAADIDTVFDYFTWVDESFSTYKRNSEISRINRGLLLPHEYSKNMRTIFDLCEQTRQQTNGYFDMFINGMYDPTGVVKGWAIQKASALLHKHGFHHFYIDAGGDVQTSGKNETNKAWVVGIRNPFKRHEHVKIVSLADKGIATSGTYIRGEHIYNPKKDLGCKIYDSRNKKDFSANLGVIRKDTADIVSLTVIGPNVLDADRYATAAFAMGEKGINFIESLDGFEGYMIDEKGMATMTNGFEEFTL